MPFKIFLNGFNRRLQKVIIKFMDNTKIGEQNRAWNQDSGKSEQVGMIGRNQQGQIQNSTC